MEDAPAMLEELRVAGRDLRERIPGVYAGMANIDRAVMVDGALSKKTKELIALAIAVARECDGCIASHARGAFRAGASEDEVAEALGVAIQMSGGPGITWAPRAWSAYQQFAAGRT